MRTKTLIIGSSPFALGYALKHKGCKIFEKSNLIDPVFAGTLCSAEISPVKGKNEYLRLFTEDKSRRKNKIDILRSEVLLAKLVLDNGLFFRFTTFIVDVKKKDGKFLVKYCDNEGLKEETFGKIIKVEEPVANENISVMVYQKDKITLPKVDGTVLSMTEAYAKDTYFINFKLKEKLSPNYAKEKILPILAEMLTGENKLLVSAHHTFPSEKKAPFVDENGVYNVCDRYFGDPSTAFISGKKESF